MSTSPGDSEKQTPTSVTAPTSRLHLPTFLDSSTTFFPTRVDLGEGSTLLPPVLSIGFFSTIGEGLALLVTVFSIEFFSTMGEGLTLLVLDLSLGFGEIGLSTLLTLGGGSILPGWLTLLTTDTGDGLGFPIALIFSGCGLFSAFSASFSVKGSKFSLILTPISRSTHISAMSFPSISFILIISTPSTLPTLSTIKELSPPASVTCLNISTSFCPQFFTFSPSPAKPTLTTKASTSLNLFNCLNPSVFILTARFPKSMRSTLTCDPSGDILLTFALAQSPSWLARQMSPTVGWTTVSGGSCVLIITSFHFSDRLSGRIFRSRGDSQWSTVTFVGISKLILDSATLLFISVSSFRLTWSNSIFFIPEIGEIGRVPGE